MEQVIKCDVLVIGSGAGGLSTAIVAKGEGLNVVVAEKEDVFGGTTALSGGALWVPGNSHAKKRGVKDSSSAAMAYLQEETGAHFDEDAVKVFLDHAPEMVDWFESNTAVKFMPSLLPDYHPKVTGAVDVGRSIMAMPFDSRLLGADLKRLKRPLATITFLGMMFNSSNEDLKHFFNATRSFRSFSYVVRRLIKHVYDMARYGRAVHVTTGNALVARLVRSALDRKIPIWTSSPVVKLLVEHDGVVGAMVKRNGQMTKVLASKGVVLACGGFPHDEPRKQVAYEHVRRGGRHFSPAPSSNNGDGLKLAESVGANTSRIFENSAAWIPVSQVPHKDGTFGVFPHLQDRYKPGIIAVLQNGKRFTNEADSYHDMGEAMIKACTGQAETSAWLICDHDAIRRYGLGFAKPTPVPLGQYVSSGYLLRGNTYPSLRPGLELIPKA